MIDPESLRQAGISTTSTGLLTNPLRRVLWVLLRPWLVPLLAELDRLDNGDTGMAETRLVLDGLRKDAMATAHRLASIEEQLAAARQENAALRARLGG